MPRGVVTLDVGGSEGMIHSPIFTTKVHLLTHPPLPPADIYNASYFLRKTAHKLPINRIRNCLHGRALEREHAPVVCELGHDLGPYKMSRVGMGIGSLIF